MDDKIITSVKQKIRTILEERGMSIYELASQSDISDPCIRNWFSKRNYVPSLTSLVSVCDVLGITLAQLFADDEDFYPLNQECKELIDCWQKLNAEEKQAVLAVIKSYCK